jgi:hypothetical protein
MFGVSWGHCFPGIWLTLGALLQSFQGTTIVIDNPTEDTKKKAGCCS